MKRAVLFLLPVTFACASLAGSSSDEGAASPSAAIQQFLAASRAKDLHAMGNVWGTEKGPASKTIATKELERRELIMIQCLPHEKATLGASTPSEGGRLKVLVELTATMRKASLHFTVVQGPHKRWFVENLEIDQLRDQGFCGATQPQSAMPPQAMRR